MAMLAWLNGDDSGKDMLKNLTQMRIGVELYNRVSGQKDIEKWEVCFYSRFHTSNYWLKCNLKVKVAQILSFLALICLVERGIQHTKVKIRPPACLKRPLKYFLISQILIIGRGIQNSTISKILWWRFFELKWPTSGALTFDLFNQEFYIADFSP